MDEALNLNTSGRARRVKEQDQSQKFVQDLLQQKLNPVGPAAPFAAPPMAAPVAPVGPTVADALSLTKNFPDRMESPMDNGGLTHAVFQKALDKMLAASGGKTSVKSGTRTPERQAQLWQAALKKYGSPEAARKWVAPPGHSNHERGLAADLAYADAATKAWAHAHAKEFGLTFPLMNEDWHIEPLGARGQKKK